jgi:hypothetical protein
MPLAKQLLGELFVQDNSRQEFIAQEYIEELKKRHDEEKTRCEQVHSHTQITLPPAVRSLTNFPSPLTLLLLLLSSSFGRDRDTHSRTQSRTHTHKLSHTPFAPHFLSFSFLTLPSGHPPTHPHTHTHTHTCAHTTLPAALRFLTPSPSTSLSHSLPFPPHSPSPFFSSSCGSRLQDETTKSRVFAQRACSQDCRS